MKNHNINSSSVILGLGQNWNKSYIFSITIPGKLSVIHYDKYQLFTFMPPFLEKSSISLKALFDCLHILSVILSTLSTPKTFEGWKKIALVNKTLQTRQGKKIKHKTKIISCRVHCLPLTSENEFWTTFPSWTYSLLISTRSPLSVPSEVMNCVTTVMGLVVSI